MAPIDVRNHSVKMDLRKICRAPKSSQKRPVATQFCFVFLMAFNWNGGYHQTLKTSKQNEEKPKQQSNQGPLHMTVGQLKR